MTRVWLLTGATGFIGRHVVPALAAHGARLKVVIRPETECAVPWPTDTEFITTRDLFSESTEWWADVLEDVDAVLHLAWYAEPGLYLNSVRNLECLSGTLNLAKACAQSGVRRFIGVGTCFEYDDSGGYLSTSTPLRPLSVYAAAKASTYLTLNTFFNTTNISFAWCRLFFLYGEGENPKRLVAYVRSQLELGLPVYLTSGHQVRDYLDVREAAEQIVSTALGNTTGPVNVCSGRGVTVKELVERIAIEHHRMDLLHFGARQNNFTDPPVVVGVKD